jgi:prefoldin subunit 5
VYGVAGRSEGEGKGVAEDSWNAHIGYLEDEVKKIDERADKLEATIPDLENEQKKHALRELVKHLRDEASEHRKYLALVKQK